MDNILFGFGIEESEDELVRYIAKKALKRLEKARPITCSHQEKHEALLDLEAMLYSLIATVDESRNYDDEVIFAEG